MADFPTKYAKKIPAEFMDAVAALNADEIKARIIQCEKHLMDIDAAKETDEKLVAAKLMSSDLQAPYNDSKKEETAKIKYCLHILEERGIEL